MTTRRSSGAGRPSGDRRSNPSKAGSARACDELASPIGPEIGVDDRIARLDAGVGADDRRRDEFVVLAPGVGGLDGFGGGGGSLPHPVDDGVVAALDALPAVVAVHRVVAPTDRGDRRVRVGDGEPALQVCDELERGSWRRVATVEERMDADPRDGLASGQGDQGDQVAVVRVDAPGADEADDVERSRLPGPAAGGQQGGTRIETPVRDRRVDPRQILEDRATGTEVQVADLGVAHLPGRQPDGVLRRAQDRVRPAGQEAAPHRHRRGGDGVRGGIPADPEFVEDDQDDRARAGHRVTRRRAWPVRSARRVPRSRPSRRA